MVAGTRGVPGIPGGVESHCQQLFPLIAAQGHEVIICRRKPYIHNSEKSWNGLQLIDIYAPRKKSFEAIIHTLLAIFIAKKRKVDILHIHAIGPGLTIPIARLLGLNVVLTHHGPDYDRQKWGKLAKFILKTGEKYGGIFAHDVIVISEVIRKIVKQRCNRSSQLIYNGVIIPEPSLKTDYIQSLGLHSHQYILAVARFVPEKGLHDLIEAYNKSKLNCKLVIAGDADHEDKYSLSLKKMANSNPDIVLTGYITGKKLTQIYSHAKLFVLPSYHEGLPISLLEALSYGLIPLVSDIPANLEVKLDSKYYFHCKDINDLSKQIKTLWNEDFTKAEREQRIRFVEKKYDWKQIARQTIEVYNKIINKNITY